MSSGATGTPAQTIDGTDSVPSDNAYHDVSVDLTGLRAGTDYCAEVVVTNGSGTADLGPLAWTQGAASALTYDTYSTDPTHATVDGSVDAASQSGTTYEIQWDEASSEWCTSNGASGAPANTSTSADLDYTDGAYHDVSGDLTELTLGTEYCAQLFATNGYGGSGGGLLEWTQGMPSVDTNDAWSTGTTSASVTGDVDPVAQATTYKVEYDTADSEWCASDGASGTPTSVTTSTSLSASDDSFHDVSIAVTGLTAGTDYCGEVVATNRYGTGDSYQLAWTQGAPSVDTTGAKGGSDTTATVSGDIDPSGSTTAYRVEYDTADSAWCTSGGTSGTPAHTTAYTGLGATDGAFHDVSVDLTALSPSTEYCGELVARNDYGLVEGSQETWTQPTPPARYMLTVSTGGAIVRSSPAGIDCSAMCSARFDEGTRVTLTGTASQDYTFDGWENWGCSGKGTCTVTITGDMTVFAEEFPIPLPQPSVVSVQAMGAPGVVTSSPAGIDCDDSDGGTGCSTELLVGTRVTLTATPDAALGDGFAGWSGGGCSGTRRTCTITLGWSSTNVVATFSQGPPPRCTLKPSSEVAHKGAKAGKLSLRLKCDQDVAYAIDAYVTIKWRIAKRVKTHHRKGKHGKARRWKIVRKTVSHTWSLHELDGNARAGEPKALVVNLPRSALSRLRRKHVSAPAIIDLDANNDNGVSAPTARLKRLRLARPGRAPTTQAFPRRPVAPAAGP